MLFLLTSEIVVKYTKKLFRSHITLGLCARAVEMFRVFKERKVNCHLHRMLLYLQNWLRVEPDQCSGTKRWSLSSHMLLFTFKIYLMKTRFSLYFYDLSLFFASTNAVNFDTSSSIWSVVTLNVLVSKKLSQRVCWLLFKLFTRFVSSKAVLLWLAYHGWLTKKNKYILVYFPDETLPILYSIQWALSHKHNCHSNGQNLDWTWNLHRKTLERCDKNSYLMAGVTSLSLQIGQPLPGTSFLILIHAEIRLYSSKISQYSLA